MAAHFEWFGVAEAAAEDSRGALTLVGVNQNVVRAPALPHQTTRVFVVFAYDEEGTSIIEGTSVAMEFSVEAPGGKTLMSQRQVATVAPSNPLLPGAGMQILMNVGMQLEQHGAYVARCRLEFADGTEISSEQVLHVVEGEDKVV